MNTIITGIFLLLPLIIIIHFLWTDFKPHNNTNYGQMQKVPVQRASVQRAPVQPPPVQPTFRTELQRAQVQSPPVQSPPVQEAPKPLSPLVSRVVKKSKPYLNPQNGCEIHPRLYLGNAAFASDADLLTGLGITHIVNCAKEVPDYFKGDFNFQYLHLMLNDSPDENITRIFKVSANFIRDALDNGGVVLVHCWAGISRSVTVVIYYLVTTLGISVKDALEGIRTRRPVANPNKGFIQQLNYIN